jgi:hypothetical protein
MKKFGMFVLLLVLVALIGAGCGNNCDSAFPSNQAMVIYVVKKNTQTAYFSLPNGIVPDSVKLTNITTGRNFSLTSVGDSLITVSDYYYFDGATDQLKLQIGTQKPDTITANITKEVQDQCSDGYTYYRFSGLKVNGVSICSGVCTNVSVKISK